MQFGLWGSVINSCADGRTVKSWSGQNLLLFTILNTLHIIFVMISISIYCCGGGTCYKNTDFVYIKFI